MIHKSSHIAIAFSALLGLFLAMPASSSDAPAGWTREGASEAVWGGKGQVSGGGDLPKNVGSLAVQAIIDLQTGINTGAAAQFIGLPQPRMVQVRLLLEKELSVESDLSESEIEKLLLQFDRTIGATARGVRGGTFALDATALSLTDLPSLQQSYLVALASGETDEAARLRAVIAGDSVDTYESFGYSRPEAMNMANTELSLTTDLIAANSGIPGTTLNSVVELSLTNQGIPDATAAKLGVGLASLSTNSKGVGASLSQSSRRYAIAGGDDLTNLDLDNGTITGGQYGTGINGWFDALAGHWKDMEDNNMIIASLSSDESTSGSGASPDSTDNEGVSDITDQQVDKLNNLSRKTVAQSRLTVLAEEQEAALGGLNKKVEAANNKLTFSNARSVPSDSDSSDNAVVTAESGFGDWTSDIKLSQDDLIYNSLVSWLGGPIVAVYDTFTNNGRFDLANPPGSITNGGVPTASYYSVTIITYIVLTVATYLACIYFLYGLYKGAEEGTFFGRNHDTAMTLGRMIISLGGNVPIPVMYGATPVQIFLLVSILFSLAISGTAAAFLTKKMVSTPMVVPVEKKTDSFVAQVLKSQICLNVLSQEGMLKDEEESNPVLVSVFDYNNVIRSDGYTKVVDPSIWQRFGSWFASDSAQDELDIADIREIYDDMGLSRRWDTVARFRFGEGGRCGGFVMPHASNSSPVEAAEDAANLYASEVSASAYLNPDWDVDPDDYTKWKREIRSKKAEAMEKRVNDLIKELDALAKSAVAAEADPDGGLSVSREVLKKAYGVESSFYAGLRADLTKILEQNPDPADSIIGNAVQRLGLGALGSMYWFMEHKQGQIMSFYDYSVKVGAVGNTDWLKSNDEGKAAFFDFSSDNDVKIRISKIQGLVNSIIGEPGLVRAQKMLEKAAADNSLADDSRDLLTSTLVQGSWFADSQNFNVSPIERIRHFGNVTQTAIIAGGVTLIAFESAINATAAITSGPMSFWAEFAKNFAKRVVDVFMTVVNPLYIAAFICSNVIPAMPYLMFTAAIAGLFVRYYCMLVAAPVWWMQKMHLGGSDITGHAGTGWAMYFQMMLHGPLLGIGFIAGVGLNWVIGHFVNVTFLPAVSLQSIDGFNPTAYIGSVLLYSGLQVFVCYKSFSLTWELPSFVNQKIGAAFGASGGDEQETRNTIAGIVNSGIGGVGGGLVRMGGGQQLDEKKDKDQVDGDKKSPTPGNPASVPEAGSSHPSNRERSVDGQLPGGQGGSDGGDSKQSTGLSSAGASEKPKGD